jgi:hypothetical protein
MAEKPKPTRELIAKMREAADTLEGVSRLYDDRTPAGLDHIDWRAADLRSVANDWETKLDVNPKGGKA